MKQFIDNKDGTVTGTKTGLMWQKDTAPNSYTWREAKTYCKELELAGYNDWRLPTIQELIMIVNYSRFNPASDPIFDTMSSYYWSSTTYASYPCNAWYVSFYDGSMYYGNKSRDGYVRAVRAGQKKEKEK